MVNKIPDTLENPIDVLIYRHIDQHLALYKRLGFTPNGLTTLGLAFGLLAVYCVFRKYYVIGALLWFGAYYYDCADGKLARKYKMTSKFGDLYDHFSDMVKHAALVIVLVMHYVQTKQYKVMGGLLAFFAVVTYLMAAQMGCQERYVKNQQKRQQAKHSAFLAPLDYFIIADDCKKQMKVTRFFTPGTITLLLMCVILSLRK